MARRVATWKLGVVTLLGAITSGARFVDATTSESLYSLYPDCVDGERERIGDGVCDMVTNNVEECDYDGGDCCTCDCEGDGSEASCVSFKCLDPSSECYMIPTPAPATPSVEEEEEVETETETDGDSAAPISRPTYLAGAAAAATAAAACGGGLAAALGW
ncbi:unnamed protein product [Scytosiphon promiscuus]